MLYLVGATTFQRWCFFKHKVDVFRVSFIDVTFSFPVGYTRAYPELVPKAPPVSLISLTPILSIIAQMVIIIGFQFFTWELVRAQPW